MTRDEIQTRLEAAYPMCEIAVHDLTGTSDHFEVRILSDPVTGPFQGKTPVESHKEIMNHFQNELASGEIHAFSIKILKP